MITINGWGIAFVELHFPWFEYRFRNGPWDHFGLEVIPEVLEFFKANLAINMVFHDIVDSEKSGLILILALRAAFIACICWIVWIWTHYFTHFVVAKDEFLIVEETIWDTFVKDIAFVELHFPWFEYGIRDGGNGISAVVTTIGLPGFGAYAIWIVGITITSTSTIAAHQH